MGHLKISWFAHNAGFLTGVLVQYFFTKKVVQEGARIKKTGIFS